MAEARPARPSIGLNDFHGQLDPTTCMIDGRNISVGGAAQLASLFDEEAAHCPGRLLLASGDNVGASPANSGLLEDLPAIDVENAWGLDATSLRQPRVRLRGGPAAAAPGPSDLPIPGHEHRGGRRPGGSPPGSRPSVVFRVNGVRVGVIGAGLAENSGACLAGATAGLTFLPR